MWDWKEEELATLGRKMVERSATGMILGSWY
jgi:hypothetical protein